MKDITSICELAHDRRCRRLGREALESTVELVREIYFWGSKYAPGESLFYQ
jgi:hypothetical protein